MGARLLMFTAILLGCDTSSGGSCPMPSRAPQCVPSCVASWLSVASNCKPDGGCMKQSEGDTTRFCFGNGVKLSMTTTTGSASRYTLSYNGATCLSGTATFNGGSSVFTYDANACGSLVVASDGTGMMTFTCDGMSTTIDASSAACQADFAAYSSPIDINAIANCPAGTCAP